MLNIFEYIKKFLCCCLVIKEQEPVYEYQWNNYLESNVL